LGWPDLPRRQRYWHVRGAVAVVRKDERRARIVAAVTGPGGTTDVDELMRRLCLFAVGEMAVSGCSVALIADTEPLGMLAGAGRHSSTITELQFELGEGPCLEAYASGIPVLLPDLTVDGATRWPVFTPAATQPGVRAEFCFPLGVGMNCIGVFDLYRDEPGMLSDEQLADALVAADIARDAMLYLQEPPGHPGLAALLETTGTDRIVVHQATGMIAAQLDEAPSDALARLRARAFESGRSIYDIAQDVVERRVRFGE
jgi:GAF domain/ANTAR domain